MSSFELFDENGDGGMAVFGTGVDSVYRYQSDKAKRHDARLLDATPEDLLEPEAVRLAAAGASGHLAAACSLEIEAA